MMCDCDERVGIQIKSMALFEELQDFFSKQTEDGIYTGTEIVVNDQVD